MFIPLCGGGLAPAHRPLLEDLLHYLITTSSILRWKKISRDSINNLWIAEDDQITRGEESSLTLPGF